MNEELTEVGVGQILYLPRPPGASDGWLEWDRHYIVTEVHAEAVGSPAQVKLFVRVKRWDGIPLEPEAEKIKYSLSIFRRAKSTEEHDVAGPKPVIEVMY